MASLKCSNDLQSLIKKIVLDTYFPVGSIYLSVSTTNPGTKFGGTWELVAGEKYLLGYSSSNTWFNKPGYDRGSTNGPGGWNTNNTTLTVNQIPSHGHGCDGAGGHSHMVYLNGDHNFPLIAFPGWTGNASGSRFSHNGSGGGFYVYTGTDGHHAHGIQATGGSQGHNHFHVSPYYTVCVWKRTA